MTDEKTKKTETGAQDEKVSEQDLAYVSGQLSDEALGNVAGAGFGEAVIGEAMIGEAI